jgi:3-deoxy-D-manno-octulosonic acid (KDO) 8-phosphate synthase
MISGNIRALAVDPTNPDIVYLGANSGGVWKSVDGGTTWNPVTDSASSLQISSIAIDPSNRNTIYAGTVLMILKSTDGGTSWAELPQFIAPLARAAVAAGVDGIFVEVQDAPERALSDGANALRLDLLGDFWRSLTAINALVKAGARTK